MNCMSNMERYIYISYKWSQSSLVDLICDKLNSNGLLYKRDVKDCTLQDSITGFELENKVENEDCGEKFLTRRYWIKL